MYIIVLDTFQHDDHNTWYKLPKLITQHYK